jgi:RteC protein
MLTFLKLFKHLKKASLLGEKPEKTDMFNNIFKSWNIFFDENSEIIRSYRNHQWPLDLQPEHPTLSLLAQIAATEKFEQYLEQRLSHKVDTLPISDLTWTDSETDFVELVYAFHEQRSFNGGNISLQNLSEQLARAFNISPPAAIYRTWKDLQARVNGVDQYTCLLHSGLIKRAKKKSAVAE